MLVHPSKLDESIRCRGDPSQQLERNGYGLHPLTLALAAPCHLQLLATRFLLVTVFTAPFLAQPQMLVCLGECDQVPQMGQLGRHSLKAGPS